jgi:hypothetical protein
MEELTVLREHIEDGRYREALLLVDEIEAMSREDKLNKIYSYAKVLLLHLIKQAAEKRTTRSWDASIYNSIKEIRRTNQRRKSSGFYANEGELKEILNDAYDTALKYAAIEVFEGKFSDSELDERVDQSAIIDRAVKDISH